MSDGNDPTLVDSATLQRSRARDIVIMLRMPTEEKKMIWLNQVVITSRELLRREREGM